LATTRGTAVPALNVVKVEVADEAKGIVKVYANARNLADTFYQATNQADLTHYAASLVLKTETANLASCYVGLAPAKNGTIDVKLINDKNLDENGDEVNYEIQYTDLKTAHKVLPKHDFEFTITGDKNKYSADKMVEMGYEIAVDHTIAYKVSTTAKPNVFKNVASTSENGFLNYATVSLKEEKKDAVGLIETVTYTYNVCGGKTLTASANVEVVKIKRDITLKGADIVWNYTEDAKSDAGIENTYSKDIATISGTTLPKETDYAAVLKGTLKKTTVKIGSTVKKDVQVTFAGTTSAPTIEIKKFAWGQTYTIEAVYDLPSVEVTIKATVKTVDRIRKEIVLELPAATTPLVYEVNYTFPAANNEFDYILKDGKSSIYDQAVANKTNLPKDLSNAEAYLQEVIVDNKTGKYAVANTICGQDPDPDSGFVFDPAKWSFKAKLDWSDITDFPDDAIMIHSYKVTTWYGQVINIIKKVNLTKPIFDFQHETEWVFTDPKAALPEAVKYYFSNVLAHYDYNGGKIEALEYFNTEKVNMDAAFFIVDKNNNRVLPKVNTYDYSAHHLAVHFDFAEGAKVKNSKFEGNLLDYADYNLAEIGVYGGLYFTPRVKNGTDEVPLPTKFDKGGIYDDYVAKRCEFIETFKAVGEQNVVIDNAKMYEIPVEALVTLIDKRPTDLNGSYVNYSLVQYTVNNVTYTDRALMQTQVLDVDQSLDISDVVATWVAGNGSNGFAAGVSANQAYHNLTIKATLDTAVPAGLVKQIRFQDNTLFVDATAQLELTAPQTFDITIKLMYRNTEYMSTSTKVTILPIQK
jgi:hypothetical protein